MPLLTTPPLFEGRSGLVWTAGFDCWGRRRKTTEQQPKTGKDFLSRTHQHSVQLIPHLQFESTAPSPSSWLQSAFVPPAIAYSALCTGTVRSLPFLWHFCQLSGRRSLLHYWRLPHSNPARRRARLLPPPLGRQSTSRGR